MAASLWIFITRIIRAMQCLYCETEIAPGNSSREHAIPQFLGGRHAPPKFQLENVCRDCNSKLGLYVDGSFAKSWFVTNALALAARKLYLGKEDAPLPLVCLGPVNAVDGLLVPEGYVCECWLGPFRDRVFWVRPHNESLYWYSGGHPIDQKKHDSTAYLALADGPEDKHRISIASFLFAFQRKNIRKILCHEVGNDSFFEAGFAKPTDVEGNNAMVINLAISRKLFQASPSFHTGLDTRFAGKLSLAVGYALFGEKFLATPTAREARNVCMNKPGNKRQLRGTGILGHTVDPRINELAGYPGTITFAVLPAGDVYALSVSIDQARPMVVEFGAKTLASKHISQFGYALLVMPHLKTAIELDFVDLVAHSMGNIKHPALSLLDARLAASEAFFRDLGESHTRESLIKS